jgi:hypothetical protein
MAAVDLEHARRAQERLLQAVGDHPDVNGVGISRDDDAGGYFLRVNVRRGAARDDVPVEVDGVTVRVQTVGRVRKRPVV